MPPSLPQLALESLEVFATEVGLLKIKSKPRRGAMTLKAKRL